MAEPVASVGSDDRPLQEPTTQRCPNCSGAAKVPHFTSSFKLGSLLCKYFKSALTSVLCYRCAHETDSGAGDVPHLFVHRNGVG